MSMPAVPPPPPAIHAPAPAPIAARTASPFSIESRSVQYLQGLTDTMHTRGQAWYAHGRYMHTKHWNGKPQRSQRSRSNRRKASKRSKR